jgi:hypothetical protein
MPGWGDARGRREWDEGENGATDDGANDGSYCKTPPCRILGAEIGVIGGRRVAQVAAAK